MADDAGRFTLAGLPAGEWRLVAVVPADGAASAPVPLGVHVAGSKDLDLRLPK